MKLRTLFSLFVPSAGKVPTLPIIICFKVSDYFSGMEEKKKKLKPVCTFEGKCECLKEGEEIGALEDCIYCPSLEWIEENE